MIRDVDAWRRWEAEWQRASPVNVEANLHIFWALLEMARAAGVWPPDNPLEGLEKDLELARRINTDVQPPEGSGTGPG